MKGAEGYDSFLGTLMTIVNERMSFDQLIGRHTLVYFGSLL